MAKWLGRSIRWFRNHAWEVCDGRVRTGRPILFLLIHAWFELPECNIQGASGDNSSRENVLSEKGPDGLLAQGQRRRIRRCRRTVLRDYGPQEAASSRRRAVGTTGPFQGPRADREQRKPPSTPPRPQYHSRDYGPGWIRRTAMPEYIAASGRHDHVTFWERADESV